jgi:hypothetical protein
LEQDKRIEKTMRRIFVWTVSLLLVLIVVACSGQAGKEKDDQEEVHEMEIIPKVKEPPTDVVDTIGFPEESHGTPITGYQGYPEDDLVKESEDINDVVDFAGGGDIEYHDDGGDYGY